MTFKHHSASFITNYLIRSLPSPSLLLMGQQWPKLIKNSPKLAKSANSPKEGAQTPLGITIGAGAASGAGVGAGVHYLVTKDPNAKFGARLQHLKSGQDKLQKGQEDIKKTQDATAQQIHHITIQVSRLAGQAEAANPPNSTTPPPPSASSQRN